MWLINFIAALMAAYGLGKVIPDMLFDGVHAFNSIVCGLLLGILIVNTYFTLIQLS